LALRLVDETYWALEGDASSITLLATSTEEGAARPQLWCRETGGGRIFVSLPGHYRWTFDDPLFRLVVLRAIAWCARRPEGQLEPLAALGARFAAGPSRPAAR
jgi:type 1 glutamine amidotransferase